ncbi:MAG: hypothetical protein LBS30_02955 [Planctomycetota bacterium]|jgi:tetratricopeptide (TPR) repeat protein|nr:hypothetical protein [Planctomycetota bacterium]
MNPYYTILLLAFLILLAVLLIRFVNNAVDREFRSLAQAANDPEYRKGEIRRVDALLAGSLPLPVGAAPLPGPRSGVRGSLPPVLLALGVILLWGAGSVRQDGRLWLYGGVAALAAAGALMLVTLRRRKWSRTARLLLFRADLKRMDNDRIGAASDLCELLKLTPWDDSAWAELSDDLAAQKRLREALEAMETATRIDPRYDEYRMVQASLAIRMGDLEYAEKAIAAWKKLDSVPDDDPRAKIYEAALQLARGDRDDAAETLRTVLLNNDDHGLEFLDDDQALAGIRDLLPGRTP